MDDWSQFKEKYNFESQPRIEVLDSVLKSGIEDYCYSILERIIVLAEAPNQKSPNSLALPYPEFWYVQILPMI